MAISNSTISSIIDSAILPCIELEKNVNEGILETESNILLEENDDYHLLFDVYISQYFSYNSGNYFTESYTDTSEPNVEIYNINVLSEEGEVELTEQQISIINKKLKEKIIVEL